MADWQIGLSTGCFYSTRIAEVLVPIRKSGISMIEVCSSATHLAYGDPAAVRAAADAIAANGLKVFSFHAPFGDAIDISALDAAHRRRSLTEVLTAVGAASVLGASHFVLHPGPEKSGRLPGDEYQRRLSNIEESLKSIAAGCAAKRMVLVLENMLPHLLFGRTPDLMWMLSRIGAGAGICLDTGHAFLGGALYSGAEHCAPHLLMLHAADNRGERDDHLPPGRGNIDWRRLAGVLSRAGFNGPVILELSGHGHRSVQSRLHEAVEAAAFLREAQRHPA